MPGVYGEHGTCCANNERKKRFHGKAFIPDDHIQLIAKNYQGANLNLEFELSDGERSASYRRNKRYRSESSRKKFKSHKSSRRGSRRRHRRKRKKQCECCVCGTHSASCKPTKKKCCRIQRSECSPVKKTCSCCCDLNPPHQKDFCVQNICNKSPPKNYYNSQRKVCCGKQEDPCCKKLVDPCCKKQEDPCCKKPVDPCCKKPVDPCCKKQVDPSCAPPQYCTSCSNEPECVPHTCCGKADCGREKSLKRCPCCNAMVPECEPHMCCGRKKRSHSSRYEKRAKTPKSSEKSEKDVKTATSSDKARSKTSSSKKVKEDKRKGKSDVQNVNPKSKSKKNEKQKVGKVSSNSRMDKKVYVAKRMSDVESSEVYGKYWYHRPPMENVISHCEEDYYEYMPPVYEINPAENRQPPTEHFREVKEPKRKNAGYCVGCKEPMCLICKNFICNCDCNRPNFVICNLCRHKMTHKKKKICPPPHTKRCVDNKGTDDCNDVMFLLPLLASMQENANCQSCNC